MGKIISMNHVSDNLIRKVSEYFLTDMKFKDVAPFLTALDYYYNKGDCDISKEIAIKVTDAPDVSKKDIVKFMVKSIKLCDNFDMAAVKNVCVDIFIGILFNETWRTFMSAMDQAYRETHSNKLFYMVLDIAKKQQKKYCYLNIKFPHLMNHLRMYGKAYTTNKLCGFWATTVTPIMVLKNSLKKYFPVNGSMINTKTKKRRRLLHRRHLIKKEYINYVSMLVIPDGFSA